MAGFWSVPGGFAEAGETPVEVALRELMEEAAIAPTGPAELATALQLKGYGLDILSLRYAAGCADGDVRTSNEHTAWGVVRPARVPRAAPRRRSPRALARLNESDAFSLLAIGRGRDDFLEWRERRGR